MKLTTLHLAVSAILFLATATQAQLGTIFAPPQAQAALGETRSLQAADLNGDGVDDVVAGTAAGIEVLWGATGSWAGIVGATSPLSSVIDTLESDQLEIADIDGDGDLDIVSLQNAQLAAAQITVFFNDGSGAFPNASITRGLLPSTFRFTLADFNGDGLPDLAFCLLSAAVNRITIHLNLLGGSMTTPFSSTPSLTAIINLPGIIDLTTGDYDGDGDLDLAVVRAIALQPGFFSAVDIIENTLATNGGFNHVPLGIAPDSGLGWRIVTADLDGNASLDLAVANRERAEVYLLTNTGNLSFSSTVLDVPNSFAPAFTNNLLPEDLIVADLNSDGDPDLVTANGDAMSAQNATVFLNLGGGTFATGPAGANGVFPAGISGFAGGNAGLTAVTDADVDGDGDRDLVFGDGGQGSVAAPSYYYLENGLGSAPSYPGNTDTALRLETAVFNAGAAPTFSTGAGLDVKAIAPGSFLGIRLDSPDQSQYFGVPLLLAQPFATGAAAPNLPGTPTVWLDPAITPAPFLVETGSLFGGAGVLLPGGLQLGFNYPGGLAAESLMLQVLVAPGPTSAVLLASHAHEIRFF